MSRRSFDIIKLCEGECYSVRVDIPVTLRPGGVGLNINEMEAWVNNHCSDQYVILLKSVVFSSEKDALIFKLKYG